MKFKLLGMLLISVGASACARLDENRNPEISGIDLSAETMPEAAMISVPMPEPVRRAAPKRAEAASLWQTGNQGFFGDHRAVRVGDILTVNIEIDDEAQLKNASSRSRSGNQNIDGSTMLGYEGKLAKILPGIKDEDLPQSDLVDLSSDSASQGKGSIARNEKINLKVAAMIIQRLENGNLVIAGRQEVKVNNELRELRVAGIIRPVDIEMNNTIPYQKIAEARITYGGRGQLSAVQKPRYGEDALEVALPY